MGSLKITGSWCNGSTTDFGSVGQGSNPCDPTYINVEKKLKNFLRNLKYF